MPQTIRLRNSKNTIRIQSRTPRIVLKQIGARGKQGIPGIGVPAGGNPGDILTKETGTDYDTAWANPSALADKTFNQNFLTTSTVNVTHNLNKYPSVIVMDSAGSLVDGDVFYVDTSQLIVTFSAPFSGRVTCN